MPHYAGTPAEVPQTVTAALISAENRARGRLEIEHLLSPAALRPSRSFWEQLQAGWPNPNPGTVGYRVSYQPLNAQDFAVPTPAAQRSAAMPNPQSRDPNVPGDGRPLRVGDIVIHSRGVATQRARITAIMPTRLGGPLALTVRPADPTVQDAYQMRGSVPGHWPDSDWILVHRPANPEDTRPAASNVFPLSLDPAVPGDGRPFQIGDIVRHTLDPQSDTYAAQISGPPAGAGRHPLRTLGTSASHLTGTWNLASFALVKRPGPTDYAYLPPATPAMGMSGQFVDPEFVAGLADWLEKVLAGGVMTGEVYPHLRSTNDYVLGLTDALNAIKLFSQGSDIQDPLADPGYRAFSAQPTLGGTPTQRLAQRPKLVAWLTRALTKLMNAYDPSTKRCDACAAVGIVAPSSASCAHFVCTYCSQLQSGTSCSACERLFREQDGYSATDEIKICSLCCDHVECTEKGYEEVMLKKNQCQTCKRGPKGCRCPGCEAKGCMQKTGIMPCCGGCESHCGCASMCMRHTGMKQLVKFAAPPEEKGMTRLLGTEIETYGSAILKYTPLLRKAVDLWQASVITDGSIGGRGVELVTQPAGGSQWRQMIADLGAGFKESQSVSSKTCGLHMHADCTDVDGFALKRIIQLYSHIEFCLYDAIPEDRQTGGYSKPNGANLKTWLDNDAAKFDAKMEAGEAKRQLSWLQYGLLTGPNARFSGIPKVGEKGHDRDGSAITHTETSVKTLTSQWDQIVLQQTRGKGHANRYSGLNMHSYWLRGTLEFRMHHGTNDPVKITNWGFVIGSIVDYCVKHTDEDMTMILGLKPRLAMGIVLDGQPDVMEWLISRWAKFTSDHKVRLISQPVRDNMGEV